MADNVVRLDTRVAYGVQCTWFGKIQEVVSIGGLPRCPHCHGTLYEVSNMGEFEKLLNGVPPDKYPDYPKYFHWQRESGQKCFKSYFKLKEAYDEAHPERG